MSSRTATPTELYVPGVSRAIMRVVLVKTRSELELELIQPHMAQKPVLRDEVGCACVARERSVSREEVWASAGVQGAWEGGCGCEAD